MIMSDFLVEDLDDVFAAVRLFSVIVEFEVILLHVVHPDEEHTAGMKLSIHGDGERRLGRCLATRDPRDLRGTVARPIWPRCSMARSTACDYRPISTATPYLQTLGQFLVERSG